ncbi:MAG: translation initiation factor IF-2 N-terminal domain-containing protein [Planctomycetes bacterium]|nr:translation initiation factor IF-2 N-terminal domain-containing protein [Planctomycetota bacterium]
MPQDKVRVYILARELNMESKDLLDLCQKANIDVKNQLSSLDPEQRDLLVELVHKGASAPPVAQKPPTPPSLPKPTTPVPTLKGRPVPTHEAPPVPPIPPVPRPHVPATAHEPPPIPQPPVPRPQAGELPTAPPIPPPPVPEAPAAAKTPPPPIPAPVAPLASPVPVATTPTLPAPLTPAVPEAAGALEPAAPLEVAPAAALQLPAPPEVSPAPAGTKPPEEPSTAPHPPLAPTPQGPRPAGAGAPPQPATPPLRSSTGPMRDLDRRGGNRPGPGGSRSSRPVPSPAQPQSLRGSLSKHPTPPKAKQGEDQKKHPPQTGPRKIADIPVELMQGDKPIRIEDLLRPPSRPTTGTPIVEEPPEDDEEGDRKNAKKKLTGGVIGRDQRHADRAKRQKEREARGSGKTLLVEDSDRPQRIKEGIRRRPKKQPGTVARKGNVPIELPITVRSLSEAMGIRAGEVLLKLMDLGAPRTVTINSTLDPDLAEALALEKGVELDIKRPPDAEEQLKLLLEQEDKPEDLVLRAPVVTIMGHVDHGKTSLLDRIRQQYGVQSNVVATEAGGITQSIRAWRVEKDGKPITFLDTPGHEAFTKMRARGANVTDIAVIVVAADDGVMPQTEEAISHARAAGVAMVVAINKVDLPNANIKKAEQQLYGLDVLPDTMGGEVPFVQTSAATGKGIDQLLEQLSVVAELAELKANPNKPAQGTCLEASVSEGEGVFADDPFVVVDDLIKARDIAEKRRQKLHAAAVPTRGPTVLEDLSKAKVAELKIILKADVRGSVEAIRKELEKLHHEEVRVRVLHTGIGGITENDVNLALTSPADTIIVGFNAVPDERATALAEERGVQIREYNIIYKLTDDIRSALEGKLKPREEIVHLGRAVVRATFKISRVGTIAGCYVTQGTIERSALVRVIRGGVVIYPPPDRTVGLDSLKRVKDDVREVQQSYECGMKISGYDDIKVDDVIEAYRIQKVQRTLS